MSESPRKLGAILYPGFEMLDYFGPLEMFSVLGSNEIEIVTVAQEAGPVSAAIGSEGATGPSVVATYGFDTAPDLDMLLIPDIVYVELWVLIMGCRFITCLRL